MQELLEHFNLPHYVSTKWRTFGILLLNDKTGICIDHIDRDTQTPEDAVIKILVEWLRGGDYVVTWQILIETLKECELPLLAEQIWEAKIKGTTF